MSQACNAPEAFANMKQRADERVNDYKLCLRARFNTLKTQMAIELTGPLANDASYATDTSLTKAAKRTKALERFNAFLFIKNTDNE